MFHDLDRSCDAACGGPPLPTAGNEVSLSLGSNQAGFDILPCLDALVKVPLVLGGCSGSVDFSESGLLG